MPIFNDTFRPHIIRELNHRKSHWHRQEVTIPNVRVTALVRTGGGYVGGNIRLGQIHGFTLGVPDVSQVNTVNQLHNLDEQGSIIGITYLGRDKNEPTPVRIPTKKNLPAPGITGVTISTQSKGGLTFKATVNFKMYGKEQYDAIYQLLFRPGNPVVIEYGHTRTEETLKDLNFFEDLDVENLGRFKRDITQQSRFPSTRTTGTVCGLVSNFKIRLNQNNEYEASMDIINALEVMYSLPTENTLAHYTDPAKAASIKANFGYIENKEYDAIYDKVFQYILKDNGFEKPDSFGNWRLAKGSNNASANIIYLDSVERLQELADETPDVADDDPDASLLRAGEKLEAIKRVPGIDTLYVDFEYFMNSVLDKILYESITSDSNGCLRSIVKTSAQIQSTTEVIEFQVTRDAGTLDTVTEERATARVRRNANTSAYNNWLRGAEVVQNVFVSFEKFRYWPNLRSINLKNVIINNESLYSNDGGVDRTVFADSHRNYIKKFKTSTGKDFESESAWSMFFRTNQFIKNKKQYKNSDSPWQGIFINYSLIKEAFLSNESIPSAIVSILQLINSSTSGILNLKLKYTAEDYWYFGETDVVYQEGEIYNLTIYDEKNAPNPKDYEDVYTFFENDTSEAISYNFDFSLPQAVSSTVLANNFARNNPDVVGEAETYQLIYNGYEDHIQPLVDDFVGKNEDRCGDEHSQLWEVNLPDDISFWTAPIQVAGGWFSRAWNTVAGIDPEERDAEKILEEQLEDLANFSGYVELSPSTMKSTAIRSGLLSTFPSSAKVSIKLLGIDGFRFGDLFRVKNMLPHPYDEYNIFMLTGYKHTIDDKGWFTDIDGIMIAGTPPEKDPKNLPESQTQELTQEQTDLLIRSLDITLGEVTPAPVEVQQSADSVQFVQQYNAERNRNYVEIVPDQVSIGTDVSPMEMRLRDLRMTPSGNNQP